MNKKYNKNENRPLPSSFFLFSFSSKQTLQRGCLSSSLFDVQLIEKKNSFLNASKNI